MFPVLIGKADAAGFGGVKSVVSAPPNIDSRIIFSAALANDYFAGLNRLVVIPFDAKPL